MPDLPYFLIDQNRLRDPTRVDLAFQSAKAVGGKVLIPDVALMEMMKGPSWEYATRRSLEFLAQQPDHVAVAWGTGDLLRRELARGLPTIDLVDEETTVGFREVLSRLKRAPTTALRDVAALMPDAQALANRQWLDHEHNKKRVEAMCSTWKLILKPEGLKALKNDPDGSVFCGVLASDHLTEMFENWLVGSQEYSSDAARRLASRRSIISHVCLCHAALALRWVRDSGGASGVTPSKMTNDVVDMEYVLLGTFCSGLDTLETKVIEILAALRHVAELRQETFLGTDPQ